MNQTNIAVIVGSLRKDSLNGQLATALVKLAPANFTFNFVEIGDLPLYDQDDDGTPAPAVSRLRDEIKAADAVIFATPEYNRSIPGVLKNAIDHASRPWGQSVWTGKPAGLIGISVGAMGTAMAQQHLRNILAFLNMPTMGQPEAYLQFREGMFNADGSIGGDSKPFLQSWMDSFVARVTRHKA